MPQSIRSFDRMIIPAPCDADWDSMIGNDRVRFCEHCSLVELRSPLQAFVHAYVATPCSICEIRERCYEVAAR
jgi:hypothetical protein